MKKIKIIIILIILFSFMKVKAITLTNINGSLFRKLCSNDGKIYEIKFINLQERESYFLLPLENYNLDLKTYEYSSLEKTNFPLDLKDYYLSFIEFKNKYNLNFYVYHALTQRLIWNYLYPNKNFRFCDDNKKNYDFYENEYNEVKEKIENVIKGPEFFKKTNYQLPNKEYIYEFKYLDNYYIFDNDGLDVKLINNKLYIKGEKGSYKILFKKNKVVYNDILFDYLVTDNENYVFSANNYNDVTYEMNIIIESNNLTIMVTDNEVTLNKCITLTSDNESNIFCANENNLINISLLKGKYTITYNEDDLYKEKSISINLDKDDLIKLNLERKNIIKENDNLKEDNLKLDNEINKEYTHNIIFENTLSINNIIYIIIFLILISIGVILVKKKK
ncbi:MAG: hypothetical protein ACI4XR_03620 [Bacilli bacterium]